MLYMRAKNVVLKINILPVRAQGVVYHIVKYMSVIIIIIIIVFSWPKTSYNVLFVFTCTLVL